jgi:hypothetical protein
MFKFKYKKRIDKLLIKRLLRENRTVVFQGQSVVLCGQFSTCFLCFTLRHVWVSPDSVYRRVLCRLLGFLYQSGDLLCAILTASPGAFRDT